MPNATGRENGTIDNYVALGLGDVRRQRLERPHRRPSARRHRTRSAATASATSCATARRSSASRAAATSSSTSAASPMRAIRASPTASTGRSRRRLLADFRFGWFNYKVKVLPSDFGTHAGGRRRDPRPQPRLDVRVRACRRSSSAATATAGASRSAPASAIASAAATARSIRTRSSSSSSATSPSCGAATRMKFGIDVRRAYNLRVPSDRHRSGELSFTDDRTRGPHGGGLALASFMLGDVSTFGRYVSPTVDARERQWRHFYYAQDTWRVNPQLTLNYGLRLDVINPQTVNEPGNGGFLDLDTGLIKVAGVGGIGLNGDVENTLNWAPRVGATYQLDEKTVHQGRLRPQLRHRRLRIALRPQRDAEPAGAVDPAAERARELRQRVQPRAGAAAAGLPRRAGERRVPAAKRRLRARAPREAAAAARRCVQRHRPARADSDDVARGRLRREPRRQRVRWRRPGDQHQPGVDQRLPERAAEQAAAVLQPVRLDAGRRLLLQLRDQRLRRAADQADQAILATATRCRSTTRCRRRSRTAASTSRRRSPPAAGLFDTALNAVRPTGTARTASCSRLVAELPIGRGKALHDRRVAGDGPHRRRLAVQHQHVHPERPAVQRDVSKRRCDRDTGPNRADLIGDPDGRRRETNGSTRRRSARRAARSAGRRTGTFGNLPSETRCAGPGTGASTRRSSSTSRSPTTGRSKCASRR